MKISVQLFRVSSVACISGMLMFLIAGCAMPRCLKPGKAYYANHTQKGVVGRVGGSFNFDGAKPPLVLDAKKINELCSVSATNGRVQVSTSPELEPHGKTLVRLIERALDPLDALTGLPVTNRLHLYCLYLPEEKRVIQFSLPMALGSDAFPWVAPVTNKLADIDKTRLDTVQILADMQDSPLMLWLFTHELYEAKLIDPHRMMSMPDITGELGFLSWTVKYGTRWFREGFASYAGHRAVRAFYQQAEGEVMGAERLQLNGLALQPFTKLAKVRRGFFDWNQKSKAALNKDYYEATLGLFLLIEHHHGSGAIKTVIEALSSEPKPDGVCILRLFRDRVGLDLHRMVDDFVFPDLGMTLKPKNPGAIEVKDVRSNSRAERMGIRKGDLILGINGKKVSGLLEYELQVFEVNSIGGPLNIEISRAGKMESVGIR